MFTEHWNRISHRQRIPLIERFRRYYGCGLWAGKLFVMVVALDYLLSMLLEWFRPTAQIDAAIDYPSKCPAPHAALRPSKNATTVPPVKSGTSNESQVVGTGRKSI